MKAKRLVGLLSLLALLGAAGAARAQAPGAVQMTTQSTVKLRGSKEDFGRLSDGKPLKIRIGGPAKYQVELRVLLGQPPPAAVTVTVLSGGKTLGEPFQLAPTPADKAAWDGAAAFKPSKPLGFFLAFEGKSAEVELQVKGSGPGGAAAHVVQVGKAERPVPDSKPTLVVWSATPAGQPAPAAPEKPAAPDEPQPEKVDLGQFKPEPKAEPSGVADYLDLSLVPAIGFGVEIEPVDAGVAPFIGLRLWFHQAIGARLNVSMMTSSGEAEVVSNEPGVQPRVAVGRSFRSTPTLGLFWNMLHDESSTFYLSGGAGPVFFKAPLREAEIGVRAGGGLGVEFAPSSLPSLGFTVEGGMWATSFSSSLSGLDVAPVLTLCAHRYLGRKTGKQAAAKQE
ncbi:MAG: hypothetical protein HY744_08520 [Deltaproteobacteria bacterium]|nr:hypothetical protein [Deltaproteobacteria bacterium]